MLAALSALLSSEKSCNLNGLGLVLLPKVLYRALSININSSSQSFTEGGKMERDGLRLLREGRMEKGTGKKSLL